MNQLLFNKAIDTLYPNHDTRINNGVVSFYNTVADNPDTVQRKIKDEYDRLISLEPLHLLREQRGTIHLPAWDKEVQIKFLNNNLPIPQNYLDWKQAYLDLPQNIAAGTIPAPTLDTNGQLIFNDWPVLVP